MSVAQPIPSTHGLPVHFSTPTVGPHNFNTCFCSLPDPTQASTMDRCPFCYQNNSATVQKFDLSNRFPKILIIKSTFCGRRIHLMFCCFGNEKIGYPQWLLLRDLTRIYSGQVWLQWNWAVVSWHEVQICWFPHQQQFFLLCENCVLGRIRIDDNFRCTGDSSWFCASRAAITWDARVINNCTYQCHITKHYKQ